MSSSLKELTSKQINKDKCSYYTLGKIEDYTCNNTCTCKKSVQRSPYDVMMYNLYSKNFVEEGKR